MASLQFIFLIFIRKENLFLGNPNNLGDLPMHINNIKLFAHGLNFWPQNPEYSGQPLLYPFGIDLFNALFESLGFPTHLHLMLVGLFGLYLTLYYLFNLGQYWLVSAFFFSGGFFKFTKSFSWISLGT
jgi:hypothetical protein